MMMIIEFVNSGPQVSNRTKGDDSTENRIRVSSKHLNIFTSNIEISDTQRRICSLS